MEQAAGRAALCGRPRRASSAVSRRRPARWRENLASYVHLPGAGGRAPRCQLRIEEIEQIFLEKGNCTVKARWEVLWPAKREYEGKVHRGDRPGGFPAQLSRQRGRAALCAPA